MLLVVVAILAVTTFAHLVVPEAVAIHAQAFRLLTVAGHTAGRLFLGWREQDYDVG